MTVETSLEQNVVSLPPVDRAMAQLHEKIRALYQQSPLVLLSNLMAALLVLVVMWGWNNIDQVRLRYWMLAIAAVVVLRTLLYLVYSHVNPGPRRAMVWGVLATVGSFLSGSLWGASSWIMFVDQSWFDLLMLGFLLMGAIGAGGVALLTPYLPAFYAFFLPSLLPFAAILLWHQNGVNYVLFAVVIFYVCGLAVFAHRAHHSFVSSIHAREENQDLVAELVRQKEEAERSNMAKSRFLAAASHDLRQPMHALGLFVETLRDRIHHPDLRRIVDNIGLSVEAMNDLFNALLDISRLDAGVIQPARIDFSLQSLLDRIRVEYERPCAEKKLSLKVFPRNAHVHSDPALLERIVRNFVTNAMRYTREGGILVGVRKRGGRWRIEVWDTGLGIPQDKQREIFQEFVQLNNPERDRGKGLGLGLAIVERLAALLRHAISVRSQVGKGSVFAVELPAALSPVVSGSSEPTTEITFTGFPGTLIMVVDDETAILDGMRILLQGWGCEAICAGSGADMMALLADCPKIPDLIISDFRLRQGESGIDVIRLLQEEFNERIPGVLITGDTSPDRLQEARASGFRLLHKPLQPAKLRALIAHILQLKKKRDSANTVRLQIQDEL